YVAPAEGIRAQRRLQRSRSEGYRREVALSLDVEGEPNITVNGRADGVDESELVPVIEEIKSTRTDLDVFHAHHASAHWAQGMLYGYLYARECGHEQVCVRLIYIHLDTREQRVHERICEIDALKQFFTDTVHRYRHWLAKEGARIKERDQALARLAFPQERFRNGQRRLAEAVYRAIHVGGTLIAEAPTGIGKTLGTLYPAVKALGRGRVHRIFFLTAKGTGAAAASNAVDMLRRTGTPLRCVELTAKAKICFNPDRACDPEQCSYARGYYDRVRPALEALLERERLSRETVLEVAREHTVCPFELSLDAARWSDVVIADVNYVFDPIVHVVRLREGISASTLLIDEAHHLPDRVREMFSAELDTALIEDASKTAGANVADALTALAQRLRELAAAYPHGATTLVPAGLVASVTRFNRLFEDASPAGDAPLVALWRESWRFERCLEWFVPEQFACLVKSGDHTCVRLHCVDPSPMVGKCLAEARASVLFSATLVPLDYFRAELDVGEAPALRLGSPFPAAHLGTMMVTNISTRWRDRAASIDRVATVIGDVVRAKVGNYLVFFPSYAYLRCAQEELVNTFPELEVDAQEPGMSSAQQAEFLTRFELGRRLSRVALAVMGGSFGESIDLAGDRLIGVIVIGVGLPPPSVERDLLRWHYRAGEGYDFAYRYPGFVRVLQNAGRLIRSDTDRGVLVLVDSRYRWRKYRRLFPAHWQVHEVRSEAVGEAVLEFWG
ncbi:MAG: ATP-dependent DNA helicase, partial [Pseudomonadales bacterium]